MMDQHQRLSQPVRWTRAGRIAVAALLASAAALAIGLGVYAVAGGFTHKLGRGCISVTFASTTGAAQLEACGARARTVCADRAMAQQVGPELLAACRRAGDAHAAATPAS
jgi:hypothetical protein